MRLSILIGIALAATACLAIPLNAPSLGSATLSRRGIIDRFGRPEEPDHGRYPFAEPLANGLYISGLEAANQCVKNEVNALISGSVLTDALLP